MVARRRLHCLTDQSLRWQRRLRLGCLLTVLFSASNERRSSGVQAGEDIRGRPGRCKLISGEKVLQPGGGVGSITARLRIWWNWQTRYFEVVVPQGVQVQVLPCAPFLQFDCFPRPIITLSRAQRLIGIQQLRLSLAVFFAVNILVSITRTVLSSRRLIALIHACFCLAAVMDGSHRTVSRHCI